ncbi:MAG: hypothetical protein H6732_04455 [Alphaproteobacteria bacterium]|nr:hypothetical protein [Alphaproteobacteria bacterium]
MKFRSESVIAHPRDAVFETYRDRLSEVAAYLDDIKAVNVLARGEEDGLVTLHNEWIAARDVPPAFKAFIKPEQLAWDDHATWDASAFRCQFDIRTRVFTEHVRCTGTDQFVEVPQGTKVVLEGDFTLTLDSLPGVPSFLLKRMLPQIEQFIVGLIQPNLEKTNGAIGRFLDDQGRA